MNNTTNDQFWKLVAITQDVWNNTYGTNELEPYLLDILQFVKKHITEKDDLVKCFIILLKESCGPLEIVVFCMRELQWMEVKNAVEQIMRKAPKDIRLLNAMQQVLDVYSEKWEDRDLYQYYSE